MESVASVRRRQPAGGVRVCAIISSFRPRVGGAERMAERLFPEVARSGCEVVIFTRRYSGLSRRASAGPVPVHRLGFPSGSKLGALSFAAHALWALATRFRGYGIVHVQNPDTPLLVGLLARVLLKRRLLFTVHSEPEALFGTHGRSGRLRLRLVTRWADGILALTSEMAEDLAARGVPANRLHVVSNGVDVSSFRPPSAAERPRQRIALGVPNDVLLFLFMGRLVELKRIDLLLRAWALGPGEARRQLVLLGEGPEGERLRELTRRLNLTDVTFEVFREDVVRWLQAADAFVLPSNQEGLSAALLEAMATGLPVLASDVPGNRAVIEHGRNGLLFRSEDLSALAVGLQRLESASLRRRLGAEAALTIRRGHSLERTVVLHQNLYERLYPTRAVVPS